MSVSTKLSGFKELDKTLGQLPKATSKRILRNIGIDALQPIVSLMRSYAPRDTDALYKSITAGTNLSRNQKRYGGFNGGRKDPNIVVVYAGPGALAQAIVQEIGTAHHTPSPYVSPAWEAGKNKSLNIVASKLGDVVNKAAAKAAKKGTLRSR